MTHRACAVGLRLACLAAMAVAAAQSQPERAPPSSSPVAVESLAPWLATLIVSERDSAKAQGVEPIPPAMRSALSGYVPDAILDRVRWRVGASDLSIPQNIFRLGHAYAMTLDDVIVFQERQSVEDPKLWAHELKHVMQFAEWGVDGFARRYLADYNAVENEAWEFRWQFMKQAGLIPPVQPPEE